MDEVLIKVDNVSKVFKLPHERSSSIKSAVVNFYRRDKGYELQEALKNVSLEVKEGEFFGIVGRNGSGKSTLLKLLAGIYSPTEGSIQISGSLTPFIELGVGFNPELTGRENVYLNGALLGFSRKEMRAMYKDIVDFAELDKFMDQKLKNYSSGMQVRLAFSIAIRAKSDILLIDEVLAVGDAIFQKKCFAYFKELKKQKKTVIFVSHDANTLQEYCDNGILLEKGKLIDRGKITNVVNNYFDLLNTHEEERDRILAKKSGSSFAKSKNEWGSGEIKVVSASLTSGSGISKTIFTQDDEQIIISVVYKAHVSTESPVYGITITDAAGQMMFQSNTLWSKVTTPAIKKSAKITVKWAVPNVFNNGNFSVAPAVADRMGAVIYNWKEEFIKFKVRKKLQSSAQVNIEHQITLKG